MMKSEQDLKISNKTQQQQQVVNPEKQIQTLFIRMSTWQRDSHGLYDYESTNTDKTQLKTRASGFISRRSTTGEQSVVTYEESPLNAIAHIKAGGNGEYQLCKVPDCEDDN
jgi:hypothetical protein